MLTTFAGTGKPGFSGDGGPATKARLSFIRGLGVDGSGNVYIVTEGEKAEKSIFPDGSGRVRKVSPDGKIALFAGSPGPGSFDMVLNDGGPATKAQLDVATGVAADAKGNLYIADTNYDRVRKVSPNGTITTFAGSGNPFGSPAIRVSGDGGPATSAGLPDPWGVAVDGKGNVYITEHYRHLVRKVDSRGIITTFAGTAKFGFSGDGGPATKAQLYYPSGVAADSKGNVYIADSQNFRVRKVSPDGKITTFAGTGKTIAHVSSGANRGPKPLGDGGPATKATLSSPGSVAVDGIDNVYIGDYFRVRKVSPQGTITTVAGTGHGGPPFCARGPATSELIGPSPDVAVDAQGNIFIASDIVNSGSASPPDYRVCEVKNAAPIASFSVTPASGQSPLRVRFDASASRDPDGSVTRYSWDFGDGTTGTGKTTNHTYKAAGSFRVELMVTDDSGGTRTVTRLVRVT